MSLGSPLALNPTPPSDGLKLPTGSEAESPNLVAKVTTLPKEAPTVSLALEQTVRVGLVTAYGPKDTSNLKMEGGQFDNLTDKLPQSRLRLVKDSAIEIFNGITQLRRSEQYLNASPDDKKAMENKFEWSLLRRWRRR
jgi:hypothetical protein